VKAYATAYDGSRGGSKTTGGSSTTHEHAHDE
jgi:hypothetical protein